MKVLILGNFMDMQTAHYIMQAFGNFSSDVTGIDIRRIIMEMGVEAGQDIIMEEIGELQTVPDLILVLKGLELHHDTLVDIKERFPKAKLVNWFFDKYLLDKPIWQNLEYEKTLKLYDKYFCSLKGTANELNNYGNDNAVYLDEACDVENHGETYVNHFQEKKYGEDIAFCGSIGFIEQHKQRIAILERVVKEGFNLKVWGNVVCEWKHVTPELRSVCTETSVINDLHSRVVQTSLINLGIDQDVHLELGHSARLYRVMCAGGLYLTTYVKGLEDMFKINLDGKPITGDEELVAYYSHDDLVNKLDFLLENDEIRAKIALNGQKTVTENHTFKNRIEEMIKITGVKR